MTGKYFNRHIIEKIQQSYIDHHRHGKKCTKGFGSPEKKQKSTNNFQQSGNKCITSGSSHHSPYHPIGDISPTFSSNLPIELGGNCPSCSFAKPYENIIIAT